MAKHAWLFLVCVAAFALGCTDLDLKDDERNLQLDGGGDGSVDESAGGSGGSSGAGGSGGSDGGGSGGSSGNGGSSGSGGSAGSGGSGGSEPPRRCEDGCDDGLVCTSDACDEDSGECVYEITTGCMIAGACIEELAFDPANDCQRCVPGTARDQYSPVAEGTLCTSDDPMRIFLECDGAGACGKNYCDQYDCWEIPPTGQTQCVLNGSAAACPGLAGSSGCGSTRGCGQDAQYPDGVAREYTTSTVGSDVLVTDSHTGLVWQGEAHDCDPAEGTFCTFNEADLFCFNSNYGGESDWRLPSVYELLDLIAPGHYMPATLFTDSDYPEGWQVWSSTLNATNDDEAYIVTYQAGANAPSFEHTNPAAAARCVLGATSTRDSTERFLELGEGAETYALDRSTGLIWQTVSTPSLDWYEALAHCEGLTYADQTDWRLPDFQELLSLHDLSRTALPTTSLPGGASETLWSSSRSPFAAGIGDTSYPVIFDGTLLITPFLPQTSAEYGARCVRDF
jgi:hypothetical protein